MPTQKLSSMLPAKVSRWSAGNRDFASGVAKRSTAPSGSVNSLRKRDCCSTRVLPAELANTSCQTSALLRNGARMSTFGLVKPWSRTLSGSTSPPLAAACARRSLFRMTLFRMLCESKPSVSKGRRTSEWVGHSHLCTCRTACAAVTDRQFLRSWGPTVQSAMSTYELKRSSRSLAAAGSSASRTAGGRSRSSSSGNCGVMRVSVEPGAEWPSLLDHRRFSRALRAARAASIRSRSQFEPKRSSYFSSLLADKLPWAAEASPALPDGSCKVALFDSMGSAASISPAVTRLRTFLAAPMLVDATLLVGTLRLPGREAETLTKVRYCVAILAASAGLAALSDIVSNRQCQMHGYSISSSLLNDS